MFVVNEVGICVVEFLDLAKFTPNLAVWGIFICYNE